MKIKLSNSPFDIEVIGARLSAFALPSTRWWFRRLLVLTLTAVLLGGSAHSAQQLRTANFTMAVAGHLWDLIGWEASALAAKLSATIRQPADDVPDARAPQLVQEYLARAARIGEIEGELQREASVGGAESMVEGEALQAELDVLRIEQEQVRAQVEQVIERQVAEILVDMEFDVFGERVWPPVSFTFVEPPKKLVISRRDRIETIYSQMLEAEISLAETIAAENEIGEQYNAVGYITEIGGLGAFPTMVVDRASLRWVLSTVAHEWVHNYLVFHPLGWNYFASQDLTTMNESVAEIVGNEVGDAVLAEFYPDMVPSPLPVAPPTEPEVMPFVFQAEMRETRLEVDRLLAAGEVAAAEEYMEQRRQLFVENGFPLRVLNQAYFAFHGSYGTSPSSTSPIGPKLEDLRALQPDLATFLETVRSFTSVNDLDDALMDWRTRADVR